MCYLKSSIISGFTLFHTRASVLALGQFVYSNVHFVDFLFLVLILILLGAFLGAFLSIFLSLFYFSKSQKNLENLKNCPMCRPLSSRCQWTSKNDELRVPKVSYFCLNEQCCLQNLDFVNCFTNSLF